MTWWKETSQTMWTNLGNHVNKRNPTKFQQYLLNMVMRLSPWWLTIFSSEWCFANAPLNLRIDVLFVDAPLGLLNDLQICDLFFYWCTCLQTPPLSSIGPPPPSNKLLWHSYTLRKQAETMMKTPSWLLSKSLNTFSTKKDHLCGAKIWHSFQCKP